MKIDKMDPSTWVNVPEAVLKEKFTLDPRIIEKFNAPFNEALCEEAKDSGGFKSSYTWEEVDAIVDMFVKYNPTLDVAKFRSYVVECSGATIEGSSSSPWLWLGALGLVGLGVYVIAKGK
ncbi:MAG: hypothetical protein WC565_03475 [Parcubacteria group bacterium]